MSPAPACPQCTPDNTYADRAPRTRPHCGFAWTADEGAGPALAELLNAEDVLRPILHLGLPDAFQHHASREDLLAEAGIDAAGIRAAVLKRWPKLESGTPPLSAAS